MRVTTPDGIKIRFSRQHDVVDFCIDESHFTITWSELMRLKVAIQKAFDMRYNFGIASWVDPERGKEISE